MKTVTALARLAARLAAKKGNRLLLLLLALIFTLAAQQPVIAGWCVTC